MSTANVDQLQPLLPLLAEMLGHRPAPATVWRWQTMGVKVAGRRVKLQTTRIGGKLYGTTEAVSRFIQQQNPPAEDTTLDESGKCSPQTERDLQRLGLS